MAVPWLTDHADSLEITFSVEAQLSHSKIDACLWAKCALSYDTSCSMEALRPWLVGWTAMRLAKAFAAALALAWVLTRA